ncbi:MAG: biotin--[acetyl-CoA-carboxylase] ligase [Anaerolineales bacterium]|nr:MAG: biotin--[acetyl-CoA-carboxylase] ligase [Anaerolineales bacterium]
MLETSRLQARLPIEGLGEPLYVFDSIGSTNDEAKHLADEGAVHGTLVVADEQTTGRGRRDRQWHTQAGSGLAMSLVLRPASMQATVNSLAVIGALAVSESLSKRHVQSWIKWPNDVIVKAGKLAGVLAEVSWIGNEIEHAVLGIGVNVNPRSIPQFALEFPASCVDDAVGKKVDRHELLFDILRSLGSWYRAAGSPALLEAWEQHLAFRHQQVILRNAQTEMRGRLEGLAPDGRLRLALDSGEMVLVGVGDLSLRPIDSGMD